MTSQQAEALPQPSWGRPVAGTFAAYLAGLAANLVVSILVARTLGRDGAGLIALALVGPNILALVGNLGLPNAVSHFLRQRAATHWRIVGWALALGAVAGCALQAVYSASLPALRAALGLELPKWLGLAGAAIIPLEILLQTCLAACQGFEKFGRRSAVMLAYRWLYVVLAVAAVGLWQLASGLSLADRAATIVAAGLIAYLISVSVGLVLVSGLLKRGPGATIALLARRSLSEGGSSNRADPTGGTAANVAAVAPALQGPALARQLLAYAWRVHVSTVLVFLILRADLFLVARLLGEAGQVGLYSRSVQVAEVILYFLIAAENVLFPRLSGLAAAQSQPRPARDTDCQQSVAPIRGEVVAEAARLCRKGLLAGAALVILFELAARWLILIPFGSEFEGSIAPLRILLPAVLAIGFARMMFSVFNALARPWPPALISAAGLVVMIALDLWWIPLWGLAGAAWASLAAYVLVALAVLAHFARSYRVPLGEFIIPRREDFREILAANPR